MYMATSRIAVYDYDRSTESYVEDVGIAKEIIVDIL